MIHRISAITVCLCLSIFVVGLSPFSTSQEDRGYRPIRVEKGEKVDFTFRYLKPTGGGDPHADVETPSGRGSVTRNDESTSIDIYLTGFPKNPGTYFLYLVEEDNTAKQISKFQKWTKLTDKEPSELGSFRMAVSTQAGLTRIEPGREDVIVISLAP